VASDRRRNGGIALFPTISQLKNLRTFRRMSLPKTSKLLLLSVSLAAFSALGYAQNFAYPVAPGPSQPGTASPHVWIAGSSNPSAVVPAPGDTGCGTTDVCYYTPQALQTAYAVNSIAHGNGGAGITIGVVDAFYNSQTEADLAFYSSVPHIVPTRFRRRLEFACSLFGQSLAGMDRRSVQRVLAERSKDLKEEHMTSPIKTLLRWWQLSAPPWSTSWTLPPGSPSTAVRDAGGPGIAVGPQQTRFFRRRDLL
jgi:hypothetical protein